MHLLHLISEESTSKRARLMEELEPFVTFALNNIQHHNQKGHLFRFPDIKCFVNLTFNRGLYVREAYISLRKTIEKYRLDPYNLHQSKPIDPLLPNQNIPMILTTLLSLLTPHPAPRFLILGTPGIGKSMFGVYLILFHLSHRCNVAYSGLGKGKIKYFTFLENKTLPTISDLPSAKDYIAIYDGGEQGKTLSAEDFSSMMLLSSPRSDNYNEFKKLNCQTFYMNPWTKYEILDFAEKSGLSEHIDDVSERYNLIGGVPR